MDYKKINEKNLIFLQIIFVLLAAISIILLGQYPIILGLFLICYGILVYTAFISKYPIISISLITGLTSLIIMLRFPYLPWGDPWYDYQMTNQILFYNTIDPSFYAAQLPIIHVLVEALAVFSKGNLLSIQKFLLPLISALTIIILYKFVKEITNKDIALVSALLLIIGTPYLHWTTQAVRESVGITFFMVALYFSYKSITTRKKEYFVVSSISIAGLVLAHHLSTAVFLIVWLAFSLTYIFCACDQKLMKEVSLISLGISLISFFFALAWWKTHLIEQYNEFETITNKLFYTDYGIIFFFLFLVALYLIPMFLCGIVQLIRKNVQKILLRKKEIYVCIAVISIVSAIFIINFVSGRSSFITNYPLVMMTNGIIMILLSLIGIYDYFDTDKLPILSWLGIIGILIILAMANIIPFVDPLRYMEFFYIPLAVVSASGFIYLARKVTSQKIVAIVLAIIMIISLLTAFPSVVFFNTAFTPGHPLYDTRSYIIAHPESEILSLEWLNKYNISGIIETDTYVGYPARALVQEKNVTWQSYFRIGNPDDPTKAYFYNLHQNYFAIITDRMKYYAEFGEDWSKNKTPLNNSEIELLNNEKNLIFDNGEVKIFYINASQ